MPTVEGFKRHVWKVVAVVLAYLLWRGVIDERRIIREFEVPVSLEGLSPRLALVGEKPSRVLVRVRATENLIKGLVPSDIDSHVDLSEFSGGSPIIRLRPDQFTAPYGVEVLEMIPASLKLRIERKVSAVAPVSATLLGELPAGFELKQVEITPERVQVEGPEAAVTEVKHVATEPVNLDDRRASFTREVWVDSGQSDVKLLGPTKVTLHVVVAEAVEERTLRRLPIVANAGEYSAQLRPAETDVTVEGPRGLLAQLQADNLEVAATLGGLASTTRAYRVPLSVRFKKSGLADRLRVKEIGTPSVEVRLQRRRGAAG